MAVRSSLDLDSDPRSIIGVREFDAPRDLVFAAFTDPKHLAQWWGPNVYNPPLQFGLLASVESRASQDLLADSDLYIRPLPSDNVR